MRRRLGQNTRAAAVIWQWQTVDDWYVVWPPVYATRHDQVGTAP